MRAGIVFDLAAGRLLADRQAFDGERQEPEMIAMPAMPMRRTGAAIAAALEVIHALFEAETFGLLGGALRKRCYAGTTLKKES